MLNENNFIALYFVKGEKTEFSSNIYFTGNIAKELQRLVRIIWKIPPYQFGKRCPQKNDIELDAYLEKQIILKTNELMASAHYSCSRDTCPKVYLILVYIDLYSNSYIQIYISHTV